MNAISVNAHSLLALSITLYTYINGLINGLIGFIYLCSDCGVLN